MRGNALDGPGNRRLERLRNILNDKPYASGLPLPETCSAGIPAEAKFRDRGPNRFTGPGIHAIFIVDDPGNRLKRYAGMSRDIFDRHPRCPGRRRSEPISTNVILPSSPSPGSGPRMN